MSISYASTFQQATDKQLKQKSVTGWMDKNAALVIYNGGKEVKVPYITVGGYKDYDRANGYPSGSSSFAYQTFTFEHDRGIRFRIDSQDVDETNFAYTMANLLSEFNTTQAIPEKDSYRLSKIYAAIPITNKSHVTLTEANILSTIKADLAKAKAQGVDGENLVIHITWEAYNILTNSEKISKTLSVTELNLDGIKTEFKAIDKSALIPTSSDRMKSAYTFYTGSEESGTNNGFAPASGAVQIDYMVMPLNGPIGITKSDKFKIIEPEANQGADAWDVNSRVYSLLILTARKAAACYANYSVEADGEDDTTMTCNKTDTITAATFDEFTLTFSNNLEMLNGTVPTAAKLKPHITITKDGLAFVAYSIQINANKNIITVETDDDLANGVYVVTLAGGVVRAAGSDLALAAKTATFTLNVTE